MFGKSEQDNVDDENTKDDAERCEVDERPCGSEVERGDDVINTWGMNSFEEYCEALELMRELNRRSFDETLSEVGMTKRDIYTVSDELTEIIEDECLGGRMP